MQSFARVTKLPNIKGRGKYISDVRKQEEILAQSAPVDWTPYHEYEQAHQRTNTANNEGREVVVALPNEWATLPPAELSDRAQRLAEVAAGKSTDLQWAVHWNKARSNLHLHAVFSERTRTHGAGVYDRDVYLTEDGRVARRKADRAKNPDGTDKPPAHRKGESKGDFGPKDTRYKARSWPSTVKAQLATQLMAYGVEVERHPPFHEYHEGKGSQAPAIRAKNAVVREQNKLYVEYCRKFPNIDMRALQRLMLKDLKQGHVTKLVQDGKGQLLHAGLSLKEYRGLAAVEAVVAAHRDVVNQTAYLRDRRTAPDAQVLAQPAKIQGLIDRVDSTRRAYEEASAKRSRCGLFDFSGKKAAQAEVDRAFSAYRDAVKAVMPYTYTPLSDGLGVDYEQVRKMGREALQRAEGDAARERAGARPAGLPYGSPEAQRQAVKRFKALCRDLPPEAREAAQAGFDGNYKALEALPCSGMTRLTVRGEVDELRRRVLPNQREQEQAKMAHQLRHSRGRGHER